ncbi:MAG: diguanylate cyclase [Deltaproteobacteria bacterium]|nr:diguanylate cyclase [Deltaproteobacteria bacterium]
MVDNSAGKVLLVDDSQQAREVIKDILKDVFPVFVEADDGLTAIKAFVEERPGFIITDIEMPSINGYRFISTIRNMDDGKDVPIIMLSGTRDSLKKKLTGFNLGASDFLIKPFEPEELLARVKSLLRMRHLMDELKEKNSLLEKLAVTDDLTGLHNRRYFFETVREQLALGLRHNLKLACMLMDIDHFKSINDTWGHVAGDDVLRKIGALLSSCKREGEILARFGGEEFIICLFNTDSESAGKAAERFRALIKSYDFSSVYYPAIKVTISIGLAVYPQGALISIDELIKAADKALYASKVDGRDRVTLYEWSTTDAPRREEPVLEK